ncbi:MAG: hypothetical protein M1338_02310 [Patescibacteria group bacterium]|nr:hypothetical protein [Patescibacteria group bacterium]
MPQNIQNKKIFIAILIITLILIVSYLVFRIINNYNHKNQPKSPSISSDINNNNAPLFGIVDDVTSSDIKVKTFSEDNNGTSNLEFQINSQTVYKKTTATGGTYLEASRGEFNKNDNVFIYFDNDSKNNKIAKIIIKL